MIPEDAAQSIRDKAPQFGEAKAQRVYLEEFRKSKKAMLMKHAMTNGVKTSAAAEMEAYAAMEYIEHLKAIEQATEQAESLRWALVAAQARVDVWRSLEASNRTMDRLG